MCPTCTAALSTAAAAVRDYAAIVARQPSPTIVGNWNSLQSTLTAAIHAAWTCRECHNGRQPSLLPLFPDNP